MPSLRDYQQRAEDSVFRAREEGARTIAGRMFTGGGKTVVFASIIKRVLKRFPTKKVMVLAHRQELIWQAREKIQWVTGLNVGVEMGEHKASMDKELFKARDSVIVSTIQTHTAGGDGSGRIGKFDPEDFCLVISDECHRAVSASYVRTFNYYLSNPDLFIFGTTATPDRTDEQALGKVFEVVPDDFDYDMNYGRENGWLAEIDAQEVFIEGLDFDEVRASAEDLNSTDLSKVMSAEKPLYGMVDATLTLAGDKKGIGFSPSVEHARLTCNLFNRYKPGCAAFVSGATDKDERRKINSDFAAGKIKWIWNCGTHTEGFDDSEVEFVVPKPTKSRSLMEQMVGRVTRPHISIAARLGTLPHPAMRRALIASSVKPTCTVLDYYGNCNRHKLVTVFDVLGGDMTEDTRSALIEFARKSGKPVRVKKSIEEEEKRQAEIQARKDEDARKKANVIVKATFKTVKADPFNVLDIKPVAERGWNQGKKFSPKQQEILQNAGFDPEKLAYGRGNQLVGIILARHREGKCTMKQAAKLQQFGYTKEETKDLSKLDATRFMDAIAKNGWKRPADSYVPTAQEEVGQTIDSTIGDAEEVPASVYDNEVPF